MIIKGTTMQVILDLNSPSKTFLQTLKGLLSLEGHSMKIVKTKNTKEYKIPALDEAIKEYENGQTTLCKDYNDYRAKIDE